ncbi:MAG: hypothetical protein Q7S56_02980 [Nanoarchaeota archaeon]|nr:hypothetical protein [Nanoarchaeota archaeon]
MSEAKAKSDYDASSIKVLEGLEGVRKNFDIVELSKKIKKKGDLLILSHVLKIKPRILNSAINEGRVLAILPYLQKSKASILASLRTDREITLFSKRYNLKNVSARNLIKLVRKWNKDIQTNPLLLLNKEEHDLIIGSLLGDASIRQREKNSCFRFSHSVKQLEYAKFKRDILSNFSISEFREVKRKIKNHTIHAIDFSTNTHPIFNYYRNLFYRDGMKVVSPEILNYLNPNNLAFWICDDGSYETKQGYIILCTNSYSLEEHNLMKDVFNKKFGLDPKIGFRDSKYYYLRFKQEDSKRLIELIKPFIPKCMGYKIGEKNG